MYRYAQLNEENIVKVISEVHSEENSEHMILINDLDIEYESTYSRETGEFIPPEPRPIPAPAPTIEEKILAESQYQTMLLELTTLGGM